MDDLRTIGIQLGEWKTVSADKSNAALNGYGRHVTNSLPVYEASQVIMMHPDELVKGYAFTTQAERELFEYTPWGQGKLMSPHTNIHDQTPRHRRVEHIHRRLNCSWKNAKRIRNAFEIMEADAKIVDEFIGKMLKREPEKFEAGIQYIEMLARELSLLEAPEIKEVEREHVWGCSGEFNRIASSGAEAMLAHSSELANREDESWKPQMYGDADPWLTEHYVKNGETEDTPDWQEQEEAEADHDTPGKVEMIGYHPIARDEKDWVASQPLSFQFLIQTVRKSKSYAELKEISDLVKKTTWQTYMEAAKEEGLSVREVKAACALASGDMKPYREDGAPNGRLKYAFRINDEGLNRVLDFWYYHILPMTRAQKSVFYTFRNIGYAKFQMAPVKFHQVRPQGQKLLKRIFETKSVQQLRWLAAQMMKFQKHEIPGNRLTEPEWRKVWQAYHERRTDLTQAA